MNSGFRNIGNILSFRRRSTVENERLRTIRPGTLCFECNICSAQNFGLVQELTREMPSCRRCGSTVRMRAMVAALSHGLFGNSRALCEMPVDKGIRGIGMSDWEGYAERLEQLFDYTNTYYHRNPQLDITAIPADLEGECDFLISSDVFEHVCPPVSIAFENACRALKPDGFLVFSVPYTKEGKTLEHFPNLFKFEITTIGGKRILRNTTRDGCQEVFDSLVFHGGAGETLEMRVFALGPLLAELRLAGFERIEIQSKPVLRHGIWWENDWSLPILAWR